MLLNSCDGLKTRCLAIASPSDVTKGQEEQDSFTPLEGDGKTKEVSFVPETRIHLSPH